MARSSSPTNRKETKPKPAKKMTRKKPVKRKPYDMTKPGDNDYDEARRATADLCRLAGMWCTLAEELAEAARGDSFIPLDEDGEPILDQVPTREMRLQQRDKVREQVRAHWKAWEAGMGRARSAILKVKDCELGPNRVAAKMVMVELFRIFFPPIILMPHEKLGDQLLRPGGPLFVDKRGAIRLSRTEMDERLQALADFSDLMIMWDPSPVSMFARAIDQDSGWTAGTLGKEIKRGKSTLAKWRDAAKPPVDGRQKGGTFSYEELLRLSDAARRCNDQLSADALRNIVELRKVP